MHLDVGQIRTFYDETALGRMARRILSERIRQLWTDTRGQTVAGFGFAPPVLRPFLASSRRALCLMPAQQGVFPWPRPDHTGRPSDRSSTSDVPGTWEEGNRSVLVDETRWPLATGMIDRLVVLHGLETCDSPAALIDEIWRVLGPGGRVTFVVPNRSGLWARRDVTPFGFGRPYSLMQLESLLQSRRFHPEKRISALYMPPVHKPFWIRTARFWERFSHQFPLPLAAGVLIVEASKRQHAPALPGLGEAVRKPLEALDGIMKPAGGPVSGRSSRNRVKKGIG
ncbi:MAG: methyltransferase domain-containing protein [Paracoccaceae bacterium]|nr:methyltransferase domain-containing protein [Paracoccaceae bacterium]